MSGGGGVDSGQASGISGSERRPVPMPTRPSPDPLDPSTPAPCRRTQSGSAPTPALARLPRLRGSRGPGSLWRWAAGGVLVLEVELGEGEAAGDMA
eukprot:1960867-Rhodomonas_salina.1